MKALRSLMASFRVVNLFLHLYGEILSSSTAISNTALILGFHSCSNYTEEMYPLKQPCSLYIVSNRGRNHSNKSSCLCTRNPQRACARGLQSVCHFLILEKEPFSGLKLTPVHFKFL